MTQILITAPRGCYFPGDCIDLSEAEAAAFVAAGAAERILPVTDLSVETVEPAVVEPPSATAAEPVPSTAPVEPGEAAPSVDAPTPGEVVS